MSSDQIALMLQLLEKIAIRSQTYTITGAADWPILLAMAGLLGILITMVIALVGLMWRDIRMGIRDNRADWREALNEHKTDGKKEIDILWDAMRHCQGECCPPRTGRGGEIKNEGT